MSLSWLKPQIAGMNSRPQKSVVTVGNLRVVLRGTPFNLRKFEGISWAQHSCLCKLGTFKWYYAATFTFSFWFKGIFIWFCLLLSFLVHLRQLWNESERLSSSWSARIYQSIQKSSLQGVACVSFLAVHEKEEKIRNFKFEIPRIPRVHCW